jgi:hypothetical protein
MKEVPELGHAFKKVDVIWRTAMENTKHNPFVMVVADMPTLLDNLQEANAALELIEKGLPWCALSVLRHRHKRNVVHRTCQTLSSICDDSRHSYWQASASTVAIGAGLQTPRSCCSRGCFSYQMCCANKSDETPTGVVCADAVQCNAVHSHAPSKKLRKCGGATLRHAIVQDPD